MSGNGDSSGGFFNVATLVITWALTGDDSLSPPRGFTGSSGQLEKERERKRADRQWIKLEESKDDEGSWKEWLSREREEDEVKSLDLRACPPFPSFSRFTSVSRFSPNFFAKKFLSQLSHDS